MGWIYTNLVLIILLSGSHSQTANRPPVFNAGRSSFDVDENERGRILTTVQATDPDGDPIRFSIDIDDYFNITAVGPNAVNVISTQGIDYEQNANVEVTITATDTVSNSQTSKQITVNVRDLNDNPPVFVQRGTNSFVVEESVDEGYRINNAFTVTDADTGVNADTEISCFEDTDNPESREACETFRLDYTRVNNGNFSVSIVVIKTLDFETKRSYILAVKASSVVPAINSNPPRNYTTTKNFVINILDSQDRLPVFLRAPYSPSPFEEVPVGSVIDVISVRDGDEEARPARNLRLQLLNDTRDWLSLTPLVNRSGIFTSNLTVKNRMDREEYHRQPVYIVAVQVSELFPDMTVDTSAVTTSHINVQIFDINDNAPEFYTGTSYEQRIVSPLVLDVEENLAVNTNLAGFLVSIIDIDIPPNNQFDVNMIGFGNDTFELTPRFGTGSAVLSLSVKKVANLDYEKPEYRNMVLTIVATDRNRNVNLTRTATVHINLVDKNDNFPHFLHGVYTTRVSPDVPTGSSIITVNATDEDSGEFGRTTYSISQTSDLVQIDPDTGVVSLLSHPREGAGSRYEVILEVTDGGGKSTTARLVINFNSEFPERPQFDSHIYNATVYENRTYFNNEPVTVRATDVDSVVITYRIISGNTPDQVFQLHPLSGQLTLTRALLKQDGRQFDVTVEASDGELNDTARIIIDLLDYNDYAPRFLLENYAVIIPESTDIGSVILNISATDEDGEMEDGGRLKYDILSGDDTQRFYVNSATGELGVNAELDYDRRRFYILQVKAEDHGVPSKSDIAIVNITVTDINNKPPRFSNELYVQYMNENDPVDSRVIQVRATDVDHGSELRYNIESNNFTARDPFGREVTSSPGYDFRNGFDINARSGEITTAILFNRNVVASVSFVVRVRDINGVDQEDFARAEVYIREEGVGAPEFLNEPWTVTDTRIVVNVTEGRSGLILNLIAVDSLTHERITRFLEVAGDPNNLFTVHLNGEVHLNRALDYEQLVSKTLRIMVEAVTSLGETSTAMLEINVVNINDNSPQFSQNEYRFSLTEGNYTSYTRLGFLSVTDRDGDVDFLYSISGKYSSMFYIDSQGNIFLRNNTVIDAELINRYDIFVEVTDRAIGGLTTSVPVTVSVSNINEHNPVCVYPLFTFFVPKTIISGRSFGQILATDLDTHDALNYFIDGSDTFTVHQTTGAISTIFPLRNSEQASYEFPVRVRDSTVPMRETLCQVNVIVTAPEISNRPIFTVPPNEDTTYRISEGVSDNTTVVTIVVRNPDNTVIDNVIYSLSNITHRNFRIDPFTGRVYVYQTLDREIQQHYELIVIASTNTTEVSRKFYVTLIDVDDNNPKFTNCTDLKNPSVLEVLEGRIGGQRVIGVVKACDDDEPPNNETFYHLVTCNDGSTTSQPERFSINVLTGEISVDPRTLDAESETHHIICINASTSRTNASIRSDQWKITINVIDRDDHKLTFEKSEMSILMNGNIGTGQEIVKIIATDLDASSTYNIRYEILSSEYIIGGKVAKGSKSTMVRLAFIIDRTTGKVTTNLPSYIRLIGGRFKLKISASSTDTESAELDLTIFVNHPSEQLVLVIDQSPAEVKKFVGDFFAKLGEIHGYTFVRQKTMYHQDPNTLQTDLNMTDIFFYVLDKDGNLVNSSTVADILRSGYDERQDELFKTYGVVVQDPRAWPVVTVIDSSTDWYRYEWMLWLIIISAIVLFIDALILICCVLYLYNMYVKKPRERAANTYYLR